MQPRVAGNLSTGIRYRVKNPDGSISTVRTMSFGTDQGEVLVPTVVNGRILSDQEAIDHYNKTGENFGIFATPEDATAYGQALHKYHEGLLSKGSSFDKFKRAIIQQESGGRYGVANTEGSGARGIGQVMPETAKALAKRLGLPWRPDLMAGTSGEAQTYQDRITHAAAQEAWQAGGGDPRVAAMYYFGGSDRGKWGPKTRRYGQNVLGRLGVN